MTLTIELTASRHRLKGSPPLVIALRSRLIVAALTKVWVAAMWASTRLKGSRPTRDRAKEGKCLRNKATEDLKAAISSWFWADWSIGGEGVQMESGVMGGVGSVPLGTNR
jgi:hypothetical protein